MKRPVANGDSVPAKKKESSARQHIDRCTKRKAAIMALEQAAKVVTEAKKIAQPKDIVDIVVSKPSTLRVSAAESK
ncbi:MAG: hypothetical protein R3C05_01205 [Pirellulaceae bacterium]